MRNIFVVFLAALAFCFLPIGSCRLYRLMVLNLVPYRSNKTCLTHPPNLPILPTSLTFPSDLPMQYLRWFAKDCYSWIGLEELK